MSCCFIVCKYLLASQAMKIETQKRKCAFKRLIYWESGQHTPLTLPFLPLVFISMRKEWQYHAWVKHHQIEHPFSSYPQPFQFPSSCLAFKTGGTFLPVQKFDSVRYGRKIVYFFQAYRLIPTEMQGCKTLVHYQMHGNRDYNKYTCVYSPSNDVVHYTSNILLTKGKGTKANMATCGFNFLYFYGFWPSSWQMWVPVGFF